MRIAKFHVTNYKAYRSKASVEVRPLTLLVGRNHAGKSAILRALPLLAHSMNGSGKQVLQLEAGGLRHASSFEELVHGQHVHGHIELGLEADDFQMEARVQNLYQPGQRTTEVISRLKLEDNHEALELERQSLKHDDQSYRIEKRNSSSGIASSCTKPVRFDGLLPRQSELELPASLARRVGQLYGLGTTLHYLQAQRAIPPRFEELLQEAPAEIGTSGAAASQILALDDGIRREVKSWLSKAFDGITIDVNRHGPVFRLVVTGGHGSPVPVPLENAGHGLSQILPVVVLRLAADHWGPGVDFIEQPESDLHPAAHAPIADLFVEGVRQGERDAVIETHSELFLLRIRRRIAEGELDPEKVIIYWVDTDPNGGAILREVRITEQGEVEDWPEGVFYEDYEEVLAIRRASRKGSGRPG